MKYLLKIAYIGTAYHGFQAQENAVTVQGVLTDAARRLFNAECAVTGCSRTDSGVHANEFFITLQPREPHADVPVSHIPRALCTLLPSDIGVLSAREVPLEFHPRYDAKQKEYKYLVYCAHERNPFFVGRVWRYPLDLCDDALARVRAGAANLIGQHDFAAFMAAGSDITDTVREIKYFSITRQGALLDMRVAADGFLYNMVRIMVGTLVEVAQGRRTPEQVADILASRERKNAGVTAPPEGLYLNHVIY